MNKKPCTLISLLLACVLLCACGEAAVAPAQPETAPVNTAAADVAAPEPAAAPVQPTPEPTPEPAPEPQTPAERAAALGLPEPPDIDINSWEYLYVGPSQSVGPYYHPDIGNFLNQYIDLRIMDETRAFFDAAKEAGYTVYIGVSYRNFEYQIYRFQNAMLVYGDAYETAKHVDVPSCNEHSTALAFDITDKDLYAANYYEMHDEEMGDTEVYKWMAEHCADYGFIVRYPKGKEEFYGRGCYDGHFRYVGVDAARYIMDNGICFEEFIALYK